MLSSKLLAIYKKIASFFSGTKITEFRFVQNVHGFIFSATRYLPAEVQGHKMFLDKKDVLKLFIQQGKNYEPFQTKIIKEEIKEGDIVLDIGAHIGYYTLMMAKLVGEKGRVFAFEPEPDNFKLLKKNTKINNYWNVATVPMAVSDKNGKFMLYLSPHNSGNNTLRQVGGRKSVGIDCVRLDDYFKNSRRINFIKMDIEGAEGKAIKGGIKLLQNCKNIKILKEYCPDALEKSGTSPKEYLQLLERSGFKIYYLNEQNGRVELTDISRLIGPFGPKKEEYSYLFCVKN